MISKQELRTIVKTEVKAIVEKDVKAIVKAEVKSEVKAIVERLDSLELRMDSLEEKVQYIAIEQEVMKSTLQIVLEKVDSLISTLSGFSDIKALLNKHDDLIDVNNTVMKTRIANKSIHLN